MTGLLPGQIPFTGESGLLGDPSCQDIVGTPEAILDLAESFRTLFHAHPCFFQHNQRVIMFLLPMRQ